MRGITFRLAVALCGSILIIAGPTALAEEPSDCGYSSTRCQFSVINGNEIHYVGVQPTGSTDTSTIPGSPGSQPTPIYLTTWSSACGSDPANDDWCARAVTACVNGPVGSRLMTLWRRQVSPVSGDWERVRDECIGGSTPPSPGGVTASEIRSVVREELRTRLPAPVVRVQPGVVVPVNFPVIFSAGDPGPQGFSVSVPLPGQVSATPTYRWSFGDGSFADGRGTPYDGTSPRVDPWHYVSHLYLAPKPRMTVSLTVTWHATFTVQGLPTFVLDDIVLPAVTHTFAVKEAHATLVSTG